MRTKLALAVIVIISIFFRYYNTQKLQYWSSDEEMAGAVVYHMLTTGKPVLVSPNSNTELTLGSAFHVLSAPLFVIANKNPVTVLNLTAFLGILTTILIYYAGKLIKDEKLGLIASFLYASSFLISIFDRRWWPLSLNSFLATLALISLMQIINRKKNIFFIPLAVSIGFAVHSQASLAIIALATILIFAILRVIPPKKGLVLFFATLALFALPLVLFEIRHPGAVTRPYLKILSASGSHKSASYSPNSEALKVYFETPQRIFLTAPSKFAESHFCACTRYEQPLGNYAAYLVLIPIFLPAIFLFKRKIKNSLEKKSYTILYSFLVSFAVGSILFGYVYKLPIHQPYFLVIFPTLILLFASGLQLINKKWLKSLILISIFAININTLVKSSFRYPLSDKQKLVSQISKDIRDKEFSLNVIGDAWQHGGGYTELFILQGKNPPKSYIYDFYDWLYRAHSLYTLERTEKSQPQAVTIGSLGSLVKSSATKTYKVGNLEATLAY